MLRALVHHPTMQAASRWAWLLLCAIAPVSGAWVPVPLAVAVGLLLLRFAVVRPRLDAALLWPIGAFYLLHLIGMAWTSDLGFGLFDLQIKLGLVLLPMAACAVRDILPDALRKSMAAFSIGLLAAFALSLLKAFQCRMAGGGAECFTQSAISFDLHPSYAAWYACWALAYWGDAFLRGAMTVKAERWLAIAAVPLLLAHVVLMASKSGVIGLALVGFFLVVRALMHAQGSMRWMVPIGAAIGVILGLLLGGERIAARKDAARDAVNRAMAGDATLAASEEGSAMRLIAWGCSVDLMKAHPLGAGTGDVKNDLVACYEAKGATPAATRRLNSHSQFLQGGAALGWPGVLAMMALALVPLAIAVKRRNASLGLFALLFVVNAAVESVLEVQAGVVLFGLMLGLLAARSTAHAHLAGRIDSISPA